jgi:D-galactarolactone cycloisomerase
MTAQELRAEAAAATRIADVRAFVFRAPVAVPVTTSFGVMRDRPMVLVRVEDGEGAVGWGEIWCNFPSCGAEHRARIVALLLKDMLVGAPTHDPAALFAELTARTRVVMLQSGEPGPFAQCIAGIDIALWDLAARREGKPLWRLLGGTAPAIGVYASGLNPDQPERLAARKREEGYTAFKLKVGFGAERDAGNLRALRAGLGPQATLMVDANQAWDLAAAIDQARRLAEFRLAWLEEPLAADAGREQWQRLRAVAPMPLAGGENLAGDAVFDAAIDGGALAIVQPDVAKWGGVTRCLPLGRRIRAAGLRYCPHFLGGGIGLLASAHLLAAVGGDGLLEIDANDNPLRTLLMGPLQHITDGACRLSDEPGLGLLPDPDALRPFAVGY